MKKFKLLRLRWFKVLAIAFFLLLLGAPNVFAIGTSYPPKENINRNLTASTINGNVGFISFVGDKITSVWDSLTGTISNVFESLFSINKIAPELSPTSSNPPITSIPPPVVTPPTPTSIEIIPVPQQIIQSGLTGQMGSRGEQGLRGLTGLQGPRGEAGRDGNIVDTSSFVSRTFLDNQVGRIFDSISNSTQGLSSQLSEEVITKLLTVSGDATIGGNITITGNITGNVVGTINPSFTLGSIPFQGATGLAEDNANLFWDATNSRLGIGTTTPTALLQLAAGTATANTAPLKLTSGTLLGTAEAGAIEFLTDAYYGTITTGAARKQFAFTDSAITPTTVNGLLVNKGTNSLSGNTALGVGALDAANSGSGNNTAIGYSSLTSNTSGESNTAIGYASLFSNTAGINNTANGYTSLYFNTTGGGNTANGRDSLYSNINGYYNTANGQAALRGNTSGSQNTANGWNALRLNTTGNYNTAQGVAALYLNVTGSNNVAIGYNAGRYELGSNAFYVNNIDQVNTTGDKAYSLLYGTFSGTAGSITGQQLTVNGALNVNGTINGLLVNKGTNSLSTNTAVGALALDAANSGSGGNTAVGYNTLTTNTSGNYNTAQGAYALLSNTMGSNNTAQGVTALTSNTIGFNNTAQGVYALYSNTTGNNNSAQGVFALYSNSTGSSNVALGYSAGKYELGSNAFYVNNIDQVTTAGDKAYSLLYGQFSGTAGSLTGQQLTVNGALNVNGTINGLLVNQGANSISGNTALGIGALDAANSGSGGNTAIGNNALSSNTTGSYNSAQGYGALFSNTTGEANIANGFNSLYSNTSGSNNIAIGVQSLYFNTTGIYNNAIGTNVLRYNTTGNYNSANGMNALYANTTGNYNSVNGVQSLRANTTGNSNTANGYQSLYSNTTGYYNTANGVNALYSNITGSNNIGLGYGAGYYETGSNTFYVDNQDRTNTAGDKAGAILYGVMSATSSSQTLTTNSALTATYGMNIPAEQTYKISGSNVITALPAQADYFFGGAGNLTMTGSSNTANGAYALYHNTTGSYNSAQGVSALQTNTTGSYNTANSVSALQNNTTGSSNTAIGMNALYANTTGSSNTANGINALQLNTTGSSNTANGASALNDLNILDGTGNNTALGYNTGRGITTGINNTILGANVTGLTAGLSNNIIIADGVGNQRINVLANGNVGIGTPTPGYALEVNASTNNIAYFHDGLTNTGCTLSGGGIIACSSDVRLKKNILDINYGLDTVMALRPVVYNWNYEADGSVKSLGFIAQEVESIVPKLITTDTSGMKSLNTIGFVPILTKAIQEMNLKINDLSSLDTTSATSLGSLIKNFLADVGNGVTSIYASVFNAKEKICVDGECLTKEDIKALLLLAHPPINNNGANPNPPTCESSQILVDNICTESIPESEPTPTDAESSGETTPEPIPTPEPALDPVTTL